MSQREIGVERAPEFINESGLDFIDISSEQWRQYDFGGGNVVTIDAPARINLGKNGHRIWTYEGVSHYVPKGWIHLSWKPRSGEPSFVK